MKDAHVFGKTMTKNAGKMAKLIGCAFRFETEFSMYIHLKKTPQKILQLGACPKTGYRTFQARTSQLQAFQP